MSTRQNKKRFSLPVWGTVGAIVVIALLAFFAPQFLSSDKKGETASASSVTTVATAGGNAIPVSVYIAEPSYISNGIHAAGS